MSILPAMRFNVSKSWQFHAAHQNPFHPGDCHYMHGHTYTLRVWAQQATGQFTDDGGDAHGMVVDFRALSAAVKELVIDVFDHKVINEAAKGQPHGYMIEASTVEEIAGYALTVLHERIPEVFCVRVYEGATAYAEAQL